MPCFAENWQWGLALTENFSDCHIKQAMLPLMLKSESRLTWPTDVGITFTCRAQTITVEQAQNIQLEVNKSERKTNVLHCGAKRELGYDRGVASCQGGARRWPRGVRARWRESGGGKARGRESKAHASRPRAAPAAPKPSRRRPFSAPAAKARRAQGQGREPGASRVRGALTPGRGDEARPSGWPLPPGTLPPPHPFRLARGLRPRIPDPRGTGPGDGEETRRAPRRAAAPPGGRRGAPCEREASGSAALPGGVRSLGRAPPPLAASRRRRASPAPSLGWRRALPSPPPEDSLSGAKPDLPACPRPSLTTRKPFVRLPLPELRKRKSPQEITPSSPAHSGPRGNSAAPTPPGLSHSSSPTRVHLCARWPKAPSGHGHSFLLG
ncbi:basic proline-rich protein-like [Leopardus geoffroyi]|uniref:basic proline-rich protein-like n=1 Tax=Leopardus geoffroyi TaxID=46844 RepID=UPI001E25F1C0|nr:basic proline-rich protein-like [Leopardus geoffroyi]